MKSAYSEISEVDEIKVGEYYFCKKNRDSIIVKNKIYKVSKIMRNNINEHEDVIFFGIGENKNIISTVFYGGNLFMRINNFKEYFYTGKHLLTEKIEWYE